MAVFSKLKAFPRTLKISTRLFGRSLKEPYLISLLREDPTSANLRVWTSIWQRQTSRRWPQCISTPGRRVSRLGSITYELAHLEMLSSSQLISSSFFKPLIRATMRKSSSALLWTRKKLSLVWPQLLKMRKRETTAISPSPREARKILGAEKKIQVPTLLRRPKMSSSNASTVAADVWCTF